MAERIGFELRLHIPEKVQAGLQKIGLMQRGEYTVVATESGPVLKFEPAKIPHVPSQVEYAPLQGEDVAKQVAGVRVKYAEWTPVPEKLRGALERVQLKPGELGYIPTEAGNLPVAGQGEFITAGVRVEEGLTQAFFIRAKGTPSESLVAAAAKGFTAAPQQSLEVAAGAARVQWKELLVAERAGGMTPSYVLTTPLETYFKPSPRLPVTLAPAPTPQAPLITLPAPATTPALVQLPKLPVLEHEREERPVVTPQLRVPVVEQPAKVEHPPAPLLPPPVHKIVNATTPTLGAHLAPATQPATAQPVKTIPRLETPQLTQPSMKPAMAQPAMPRFAEGVAKQASPTPPIMRMPAPPAHPPMQIIPRMARREWTVTWLGAPKLPQFRMPQFRVPGMDLGGGKPRRRR